MPASGILLSSDYHGPNYQIPPSPNPYVVGPEAIITGDISYLGGDAIQATTDPWAIVNSGTLGGAGTGAGIRLGAGGSVQNFDLVTGATGVVLVGSGEVMNFGTIKGSKGSDVFIGVGSIPTGRRELWAG